MQKTGNAIASNIGLLCEDKVARTDARIKANYSLYSGEKVQEFDNVSEFAGYISDEFMDAERTMQGDEPLYEKPMQKKATTAAVLARMDEIVYTANKDVDELLQVYHPEYSRNRHFLAYPIGQFFSAIYSLWNVERGEIDIEFALLRECLNSGIMSKYSAERLLKTLMNLAPLFANVETFTEFKNLFEEYQANYAQVVTSNAQANIFSLRIMNIYNSYKVSKEEIGDLFNAIFELNEIAAGLFSSIGPDERFEFKKHFERLNEFVRERQASLASEEENHAKIWEKYTGLKLKPSKWKIFKYSFLARVFGFTFAIKLMESGEENAQKEYDLAVAEYEKIANKDSFLLFVYRDGCYGCGLLAPGIKSYIDENEGATIYSMKVTAILPSHTLYKDYNITDTPYLILIENGAIKHKEIMSEEVSNKSQAKTWFYDWMEKHVIWEE